MTDLSQSLEWSKGRFTDLTEEHQSVQQWLDQSQSGKISPPDLIGLINNCTFFWYLEDSSQDILLLDPVMYSAQVSVLNKIKGFILWICHSPFTLLLFYILACFVI